MPNEGIIYDIKGFAQQVIDFFSGSEQWHQQLITAFTKSFERYTKESYLRHRISNFERALKDLNAYPDPINCLLVIARFLSEGGWKINSANTLLILELINTMGYQRSVEVKDNKEILVETDAYLHLHVVEPLSTSLRKLITRAVEQQKRGLKEAESKQKKLEEMHYIKPQAIEQILLSSNAETAKKLSLEKPDKDVFHLTFNKANAWQLTWYDRLGKPNFMPLRNDLQSLLSPIQGEKIINPGSDLYNQITVCCNKLLKSYIHVYLFNEPNQAAQFAKAYPEKYSFSLLAKTAPTKNNPKAHRWQLTWYDFQGKSIPFAISPDLQRLLSLTENWQLPSTEQGLHYKLKEECARLVKQYIQKVNLKFHPYPTFPAGYNLQLLASRPKDQEVKNNIIYLYKLSNSLEYAARHENGEVYRAAVDKSMVNYQNLMDLITSGATEIPLLEQRTFFQAVAEKGYQPLAHLNSTFVLSKPNNNYQLSWYNSLGIAQLINLADYPKLNAWFNQHTQLDEEKLMTLKGLLVNLNLRREVDVQKQISALKTLQKRRGITLIAADDFNQISRFKLLFGVYLLTREPEKGQWVLYQRQQKGVLERINTEGWDEFYTVLAQHDDKKASQIETNQSLKSEIQKIIGNSVSLNCIPVNDFKLSKINHYKESTFIITKINDEWLIYHIDALKRALEVKENQYPEAYQYLKSNTGSPEALTYNLLKEISKTLKNYRPASRMKLDSRYDNIKKCLMARYAENKNAVFDAEKVIQLPPSETTMAARRAALEYSLFGNKTAARAEQSLVTDCLAPN